MIWIITYFVLIDVSQYIILVFPNINNLILKYSTSPDAEITANVRQLGLMTTPVTVRTALSLTRALELVCLNTPNVRYFSCLSFRSGAGLKVDLCEQLIA